MKTQPEDDEELKTIFKFHAKEKNARFMRELLTLFILGLGFSIGMLAFGSFQYWNCTMKDPDMTMMQCFRGEAIKRNKSK